MKNTVLIILLIFAVAGTSAQDIAEETTDFLPFAPEPFRTDLPEISFDTGNRLLIKAFYPEYYSSDYKLGREIRWVNRNDSAFIAQWDSLGYTILVLLEEYSGIKWQEEKIDVNLMRYLRTDVLYEPPCFPLEAVRMEDYTEAGSTGMHQLLDLIKLMAGRNLMQYELPGTERNPISRHPLMQKSSFRFDLLTLTLTLATARYIIPPDSLERITQSVLWKRHNPGWEVYDNHFRYSWVLTPEQPLLFYLSREPYDSPLVSLTRAPRPPRTTQTGSESGKTVELSAGGGRFGFSVTKAPTGLLQVVDVDTLGLAYANGLMPGDLIKRINGEIIRNARDLMSKMLDQIDANGVYMIIVREGQESGLLFLPIEEQY